MIHWFSFSIDDIMALWDANQHQSQTIPSNRSGSSKPPRKSARIRTRKFWSARSRRSPLIADEAKILVHHTKNLDRNIGLNPHIMRLFLILSEQAAGTNRKIGNQFVVF